MGNSASKSHSTIEADESSNPASPERTPSFLHTLFFHWSLGTSILILITCSSILVGVLAWYFTVAAAQATAYSLAISSQSQVNLALVELLDSRARVAKNVAFALHDLVLDGIYEFENPKVAYKVLASLIRNNANFMSGVYITTADGRIMVAELSDGSAEVEENNKHDVLIIHSDNQTFASFYNLAADGSPAVLLETIPFRDLSDPEWVSIVRYLPKGIGAWTDPYEEWVTYSLAVHNRKNPNTTAFYYSSIDLAISFVGSRLQMFANSSAEKVFIAVLDKEYRIVGISDKAVEEKIFYRSADNLHNNVYNLSEVRGNSSELDYIEWLTRTKNDTLTDVQVNNNSWTFMGSIDGGSYYVTIQPYKFGGEKDWFIFSLTDSIHTTEMISANNKTTLLIVASIVVVTAAAGGFFAYVVSRRLGYLCEDIKKLAKFKFREVRKIVKNKDKHQLCESNPFEIREVHHIEEVFYDMAKNFAGALQQNRKFSAAGGGPTTSELSTESSSGY
ncbi:hypothetical protein BJ742DRAFT_734114 [Cladochytrium replicatum]|nr:hypothetical protein BJ742DRAFT_734114 [Cladochytrium replicatum]